VAYTATIASGTDVVFHITHATYNILGWKLAYRVVDAGARVVTLTVTDADSGAPIPSVLVSVYNAVLTVRVGRGETDASGQLVLHLDDGSYSLLLRKMGQYEFSNPVSLVVSGATALSITGSVFSPSASPSPSTCIVYADEFDGEGDFAQVARLGGANVSFSSWQALTDYNGTSPDSHSSTSDPGITTPGSNWALTAGSNCRHAGIGSYAYVATGHNGVDFDKWHPDKGAWSSGAGPNVSYGN